MNPGKPPPERPYLFVWRDHVELRTRPVPEACLYCGIPYENIQDEEEVVDYRWTSTCLMCGHWLVGQSGGTCYHITDALDSAILRRLDIDDPEVLLAELGSHLRVHFADIYQLSYLRFEQLVADVFKQQGYRVRCTARSHDGGYDLILLERNTDDVTIVECKRYSDHRPITVGITREVMGVQLVEGFRRAKIVTTSRFTRSSQRLAQKLNSGSSQFALDLVDAEEFSRALGVYNTKLPRAALVDLINERQGLMR